MTLNIRFVLLIARILDSRPAGRMRDVKAKPHLENLESRLLLDRTPIDMAHVHIGPSFDNGAWSVTLEDTTHGGIYAPDDVLLIVNPNAIDTQPAGWDFIGAGDGGQYWHLTQIIRPDILTMALDTEEMPPGMFDTYTPRDPRVSFSGEWIKVSLRDFSGPGDFSAWTDDQTPSSWWISTADGGRTYDPTLYIEPGDHFHYNFGFTAPGVYDVTLEVSAYPPGGHGLPIRSDPFTLEFNVEDSGSGGSGTSAGHRMAHAPAQFQAPFILSSIQPLVSSIQVMPLQATSEQSAVPAQTTVEVGGTDRLIASVGQENRGLARVEARHQDMQGPADAWFAEAIRINDPLLA